MWMSHVAFTTYQVADIVQRILGKPGTKVRLDIIADGVQVYIYVYIYVYTNDMNMYTHL